jgi:hypothetical protein
MQIDPMAVALTIASLLATYYFYRKSVRIKEPYWAIHSNNLIQGYSSKLSDLRVLYKREKVENLTISKVLFWNNGADTIDRLDIMTANQLRITGVDKTKLLDVKLLAVNNPSSQFSLEFADDKSCAYLSFDYLDNKQGAVIQVVHSGISSDDIIVTGDVKGVKALKRRLSVPRWITLLESRTPSLLKRLRPKGIFSLAILAGFLYALYGLLGLFLPPEAKLVSLSNFLPYSWVGDVFSLLLGMLMLFMGFDAWGKFSFAPRGLELFDERES